MMASFKFRCRVRELRAADRGSLRFVAAMTGVCVAELRRIEDGKDPRLSDALALAAYFELPVTEVWVPAQVRGDKAA
jgi:transcriptional regulator with XRE-family HTH domain